LADYLQAKQDTPRISEQEQHVLVAKTDGAREI